MSTINFLVALGLACWTVIAVYAGYKAGRFIEKSRH